MAKGTKTRYSIELDFTTDKAEQSVRAATDKIKERLNSIATETNKTKYFEGLIEDIRDVDAQLTQLKEKHGKDFESIYQGIGEGARQEFELVFAYARSETEKFYAEVKERQAKLSGLQQIQKDYKKYSKSATQAVNGKNITGFGRNIDGNLVREAYDSFDQLLAKKSEFEKVGDTSSMAYLENYVQILKNASALIKADRESYEDATDFGIDIEKLSTMAEKAKSILSGFNIDDIGTQVQNTITSIVTSIQEQIRLFAEEMPNRIKDAFGKIDQSIPDMSDYDKLKEKIKEYYDLVEERNNNPTKSRKREIQLRQAEIQDEITGLTDESQIDTIFDIFDKIDEGTMKSQDAILEFANILGVNIPQAFQKVSQSANTAEKSVRTVMYHLGNLLSGKGARDTFDQMPYNLTEAANGTRLEKFGFGVLGGGLFGVTNPATIDQNPAGSRFIQSIDISKYNMYMADTEERAASLIDFLSKLQKFSIKNAEPNYTGFDQQLNGVNIDSLYQQFKELFAQSDLTKEKLELFINDMVALLQQAGLKFDEDSDSLDFTSIGKLEGTANISTRFMKMLGYQGVNVGTTSFDGLGQGSVLFDFDPSDIVGYFNTIDQAIKDYENITKQLDGNEWVGTIEQLQQYKQNIDEIINRLQEFKNTPIGQADSQNLDKTLSRLEQIKTKIDGAIAGNNESPFIQITESANKTSTSIDQASTKVKEFLALVDEIHNKSFSYAWDATDNVKIGEYTERLNVAKAALDELGNQGQLTADQLEQVNNAFDQASRDLDEKTKTYDSYYTSGQYSYTYLEEYETEKDRANQLEQENENLREQLSKSTQKTLYETPDGQLSFFDGMSDSAQRAEKYVAGVAEEIKKLDMLDGQLSFDDVLGSNEDQSSEISQLNALQEKLVEVKSAIDTKTKAFEEEYVTVDAVVDAEIQSLQSLLNKLQEVLSQINIINESFTKVNAEIAELQSVKDVDVEENITSKTVAEKVKEVVSRDYALDTTLVETNGILNQILAAIGNNESFSQLVEPLNATVTELKNVANGIVAHQKAQKTDLSDASSRIANQYGQLSSVATMAVSNIGSDIEIKGMKALADNIVRVEGAVRDASGAWNGFIVDINEANQASIVTTNTQSELAKSLNKAAEIAKQVGANTKNATDNSFTQSLNDQINSFNDYRQNLQDVGYISDDLKTKLNELGISLKQVTNTADLDTWKDSFSEVQKQITLAKDTFTAQQVGKVNQAQKTLEASFKTLDFKTTDSNLTAEQQQLVDGYMKTKAALEAYKKSAQQGNQIELGSIQNVTDALYKQIEAYKQIHNIVNAGGGSKNAYGATAVLNAKAKYNSLSQQATSGEFANSKVVQQMLENYTAAYQRLIAIQSKFKAGESLTDEQVTGFKQAQTECNNYAKELNKVIVASQKLASGGTDIELLGGDFEDTITGRQNALTDFIETTYGASAKIGEFKDSFNKLTFAVDNGDGTFTQMTATINSARNAIVATAGDTQKATTAFGRFFNELKGKFKTISTYLISSFSLQEIWQQIRQGVNYVREIDSALTELKKVTDETDATYEKFLQTASRTAGVIGSTVADFTNATADFARLGYNIEEASKLAEAASVYKNVGDGIDDVATASESIISTMKAFGIEAENAMGIVDRFNEVGNNFAISSTGIGEALQRSASALYEAGNTIDESVALITAAMKNWLFIQKCIKRMHLIAGKSLESYKPQHS